MVSTDYPLGYGVVIHMVLCLLFGLIGIKNNSIILSYYAKKAKLDQLSIIYGSMSSMSLLLSVTMVISFFFFLCPDLYYKYTNEVYCQPNGALFFSALLKLVFMVVYRSLVSLVMLLTFLTASKVKWRIFKIRTKVLRYLVVFKPILLFLVIAVNCFIEVSCTTPFYLPWLGTNNAMAIIYFWCLLVLPAVVTVNCLVFLVKVIMFDKDRVPEGTMQDDEGRTLDTINEEEAAGPSKVEKVKKSLLQVKSKLTGSAQNLRAKFDDRTVTKRTILTILTLATITVVTVALSVIFTLESIYSSNNILKYNIQHTEADVNIAFVLSELLPVFAFCVVNPLVLMYRVNGVRKFTSKLYMSVCGVCMATKDKIEDRLNVDA